MIFLKIFDFIKLTTRKLNIDESHGLLHSMQVLHFAHENLNIERKHNLDIDKYENIIYISAALHDMCDNKYINEDEGIKEIETFLDNQISKEDCETIKIIIRTMSYSKVKKYGFPILNEKMIAYHIVREADLLSALDFDRCMSYNMLKLDGNIYEAFHRANILFNERMFRHNIDNLYTTQYAKNMDILLQNKAHLQINNWKKILKITKNS